MRKKAEPFLILAIASGLLFSVSATDMLAGQIGVAKGKRMPMVQASGGRLYWLMLLPVLPAIASYVLMWRAGDVYRADRRYSQWRLFCCCRRFSGSCFFCMTESTCFRCHKKVGRITELENGLFCSLVRWQPPWYGNFYAVVCMSCWLEN